MRALIVEDESALREQIAARLRDAGYAVDEAAGGVDAEHIGLEYPLDVAVVDLGLPDRPGIDVIRAWRGAGRRFPVLILTARGRWQEKVEGLEAGADDYLVKPVHLEELLARLRALIRRSAGFADPVLRFGRLALDTGSQSVLLDGGSVAVTAYEFRVLECLMVNAGKVLSKTELMEHVYEEDLDPDSNVLEVLIARVRRKLDPDRSLNPIETLRGRGYRFRLEPEAA